MRAIKKINNNVVTCIDDDGNELIAMGRGLGFGELPRGLKLSEISRTFYDVGIAIFPQLATYQKKFSSSRQK